MKHDSHRPVLNYHVVKNIVTNCCLRFIFHKLLIHPLMHARIQLTWSASRGNSGLSLNWKSRLQKRLGPPNPSLDQVSTQCQLEHIDKRSLGVEIMLSHVHLAQKVWTASRTADGASSTSRPPRSRSICVRISTKAQ